MDSLLWAKGEGIITFLVMKNRKAITGIFQRLANLTAKALQLLLQDVSELRGFSTENLHTLDFRLVCWGGIYKVTNKKCCMQVEDLLKNIS
jgi:hypothetical protein